MKRLFTVLLFCLIVALSSGAAPAVSEGSECDKAELPGLSISGLAMMDDAHYVAVHDFKSYENGQRLTVLALEGDPNKTFKKYPVKWPDDIPVSSDLEAISPVPGTRLGSGT